MSDFIINVERWLSFCTSLAIFLIILNGIKGIKMKRFLNTYLQKRNVAYLNKELSTLIVLLANNKQNEFIVEKSKELTIELKRREILDKGNNLKRYALLSEVDQVKLNLLNEKISTMKTAEDGWILVNSIKDFLKCIKHYYSFWFNDFGKGLTLGEWCVVISIMVIVNVVIWKVL